MYGVRGARCSDWWHVSRTDYRPDECITCGERDGEEARNDEEDW